ncbi:MAG: 5-formyltetrahydrofolate cyclo-ligase [Janthinobacterium lividum]
MIDKKALRARMRADRDGFASRGCAPIGADARFTDRLTGGQVIASYAPLGSEADPAPLAQAARLAGCRLALPEVIDRATPLRFRAWDGVATLAQGPFGLRVPQPDWPEVVPDVILTPLLAFDARLNRLGQGAGHYDRAFETFPAAWRVGVAWSMQRVAALVADPWDVPLHVIITENDWWTR